MFPYTTINHCKVFSNHLPSSEHISESHYREIFTCESPCGWFVTVKRAMVIITTIIIIIIITCNAYLGQYRLSNSISNEAYTPPLRGCDCRGNQTKRTKWLHGNGRSRWTRFSPGRCKGCRWRNEVISGHTHHRCGCYAWIQREKERTIPFLFQTEDKTGINPKEMGSNFTNVTIMLYEKINCLYKTLIKISKAT